MMLFDPLMMALMLVLATGAMSLGLSLSTGRLPSDIGRRQSMWAHALPLAPAGWCLIELASRTGMTWLAVPGKVLVILAFGEFLRTLLALQGHQLHRAWWLAPGILVALVSSAWIIAYPSQPLRTGLLSLLCSAAAAGCAWVATWPVLGRRSDHAVMVSTVFAFCAMLFLVRGLLTLVTGAPESNHAIATPLAYSLLFGGALLAPCVATLGFVLMESERRFDHLRRESRVDALTGVCTRQGFLDFARDGLTLARGNTDRGGMLVIDVDHFKRINDVHGHDVGDAALREIADALQRVLRAGDRIGRLGGEEFGIWMPRADPAMLERNAQRVRDAVAALRLVRHGREVALAVSVGVAMARGVDSLGELLRRAEEAMHGARQAPVDRSQSHRVASAAGAIEPSA